MHEHDCYTCSNTSSCELEDCDSSARVTCQRCYEKIMNNKLYNLDEDSY